MRLPTTLGLIFLTATLAACGQNRSAVTNPDLLSTGSTRTEERELDDPERTTIWDVFGPNNAEQTTNVNRYLWAASLDVLNFLPVQEVDPFTGVIVTGYGTPPGGGRQYRATVHISDPALAARSLSVALQSSGGSPVSAATTRARPACASVTALSGLLAKCVKTTARAFGSFGGTKTPSLPFVISSGTPPASVPTVGTSQLIASI